MATSGVFTYNPEIADLLRESFERILLKPSDIGYDKIESGVRSANFVLQEFSNRGFKAYEMALVSQTVTAGDKDFTLPANALRVFTAVLRRGGVDTPMVTISREDYEAIPNKESKGRPSELFVDAGAAGITARTVNLWPVPENSTDIVRMWTLRRPERVVGLAEEPGIAIEWIDAFCAALAARLAAKYAPALESTRKADAEQAFQYARDADRDRAPLRMRMSTRGRRGWR